MPVLIHPLEELTRKTGFQATCTKLLIQLLVLLRQWKITFSIHHPDLVAAEFGLTQATVVFASLCDLYLEVSLRTKSTASDSSSKQLPFILSSTFSSTSFFHLPSITDLHSPSCQTSFFSVPTFLSDSSTASIYTLLDILSKKLGYSSTHFSPTLKLRPSSEEVPSHFSDGVIHHSSTFASLSTSSISSTLSAKQVSSLPSSPFHNPLPLLSFNTSASISPFSSFKINHTRQGSFGNFQISTSHQVTAPIFSSALSPTSELDTQPTEELIGLIISEIQLLEQKIQSEFFGNKNGDTSTSSIKVQPSVKILLEVLGEKAFHVHDFPSLILLLKAFLQRIKLPSSSLHNYLNFFSLHPSLPLLSSPSLSSSEIEKLPDYIASLPPYQSELIDFWWTKNKLGPLQTFSTLSDKLKDYLKENDLMVYTIWKNFNPFHTPYNVATSTNGLTASENLFSPDDLTLDIAQPLSLSDFAQVFPCDSVYGTTIGDWILWRLVGWLYLALEVENKIYTMRKKVPLAEHERPVNVLQNAMNQIRCKFGYTKEIHHRLTSVCLKLVYRAYPMFSLRFHQVLRFLCKVHSQIFEILSKPFLHASDSHAWAQVWELVRHNVQHLVHTFHLSICSSSLQENQRLGDCTHMMDQVGQQAKPLVLRFFINPLSIYRSPSGFLWMHLSINTTPFAIAPSSPRLILDPLSLNKICQAMSVTHPHVELIYGVTVLHGHWNLVTESSEPLDLFSKSGPYASPSSRLTLACDVLSAGWALSSSGLYLQYPIELILVNQTPKLKMSNLNHWISADHDNSTLTTQSNPEVYFRYLTTYLLCSEPNEVFPEFQWLVHILHQLWNERFVLPGQDRDGRLFFKYAGNLILEYRIPSPSSFPFQIPSPSLTASPSSDQTASDNDCTTVVSEAKTDREKIDELTSATASPDTTAEPLLTSDVMTLENAVLGISLSDKSSETPPTPPHSSTDLLSISSIAPAANECLSMSKNETESPVRTSSVSFFSQPPSVLTLTTPPLPPLLPRYPQPQQVETAYSNDYSLHQTLPQPLQTIPTPTHLYNYSNSNLPSSSIIPYSSSSSSSNVRSPSDLAESWKKAIQIYRDGQGDVSTAFALFNEVSTHYPLAFFYMAETYYFGSKVHSFQQDPSKAFSYYQKALSMGCLVAHVGLGDCMYFGFAGPRDLTQAQHHYMQSLKLTTLTPKLRARAWAGLGDCQYDVGDYVTAVDAYLNATQLDISLPSKSQPSKRAYSRLASMYIHGQGVKKDLEKAKLLLKHARLCRREVLAKSEWFRANGEPQKADAYLEEYLWRFPIDY